MVNEKQTAPIQPPLRASQIRERQHDMETGERSQKSEFPAYFFQILKNGAEDQFR